MTMILSQRHDDSASSEQHEGQIREFVRRDGWPRTRSDNADASVSSINLLIDRVAGASLQEIERAIQELENVRERLKAEGHRVQQEISEYANLSQSAMASLRIINDSLSQLQPAPSSHDAV